MDFADKLEKATIDTIEAGEMTKRPRFDHNNRESDSTQ